MSPKIEVSEEIYNQLAELAVGFDTPENVIARLINERHGDGSSITSAVPHQNPQTAHQDPRSFVESAFYKYLNATPRPFGQNASVWVGASDGNKGVQWNIAIHRETGETYMGVNLEGMKYKNWPITNLLLAEQMNAELPSFASIEAAKDITIRLTRDAWQAAARPRILEKEIDGSGTLLKDLTESRWTGMVSEALKCLNPNIGFKGRGQMVVTLEKSGEKVSREVSPHLTFQTLAWKNQPDSIDEATDMISSAHNKLLPLYKWVETRSQ